MQHNTSSWSDNNRHTSVSKNTPTWYPFGLNFFWYINIAEGGEGLIHPIGTKSAEEGMVMEGQRIPWSLLWQLSVSPFWMSYNGSLLGHVQRNTSWKKSQRFKSFALKRLHFIEHRCLFHNKRTQSWFTKQSKGIWPAILIIYFFILDIISRLEVKQTPRWKQVSVIPRMWGTREGKKTKKKKIRGKKNIFWRNNQNKCFCIS